VSEHFRELQHAETLLELGRPAEAETRLRGVLAEDPEHDELARWLRTQR